MWSYKTKRCIFEGNSSQVFLAEHLETGQSLIVKQLRGLYPSADAMAAFAREFEITRAAAGPQVIEAYELRVDRGTAGIVMEDFGAQSVAQIMERDGRLELRRVLDLAVQVTQALNHIHRHGIVHKDINPSNIVWNTRESKVKLIDFGISQVIDRAAVRHFSGTPAYMSPEQTGRMNRDLDARSDLYSFGVTLYELLTGQRPFESEDPLDLVHAHIARSPAPPHELVDLPPGLSELVMMLLNKRAEDRYAGASGLGHDLAAIRDGRAIELRRQDRDTRLRIPQKLYGREAELVELVEAFEQAASGQTTLLLVAGAPGVGKTSLIHEVQQPLVARRGLFVEGKFDQLNRGTPYDSLIQALRGLVRQLLTESEERIALWRETVLESVGGSAQVLLDVLPESELLLGSQPALEELAPTEARNRFRLVMASFLRALGTAEHPLVLFLDDLQWADLPTLELLSHLATDPETRHLLVLGAYRDNEVHPSHPLMTTLGGLSVHTIELGPLPEKDVLQLVGDTVEQAPGFLRLALLCQNKTHGNAFFLRRFLESIFQRGLLEYDLEADCWTWDQETLQAQSATDNVVDFMTGEIEGLPPECRAALQVAACVGNTFDLTTLAQVLELDLDQALKNLKPALKAELIQPLDEHFYFAEKASNFKYRFAHDRVQQAAYATLTPDQVAATHLGIARQLDPDQQLFEAVEHMNQAGELLDTESRVRLVELNLEAGRRATRSAAFEPAHAYYLRAYQELEAGAWESRFETARAVHLEGARAAYLSGHYEVMDERLRVLTEHCRSPLERVEAKEIKIQALIGQQRLVKAVYTALEVLEELDCKLDPEASKDDIQSAIASALTLLAQTEIRTLGEAEDPQVVAALRIQNQIMAAAYLGVPNLLPLLCANMVQTSLKRGLTPEAVYGYSVLGLVLVAVNMLEAAYQLGKTAMRMLERWDDRAVKLKNLHVVGGVINGYMEPLRSAVDNHRQVYRLGVDTGDLEYAAWGLHNEVANSFWSGMELNELAATTEHHMVVLHHHKQLPALACTYPFAQLLNNLLGKAEDPAVLIGPDYNEQTHMAELLEGKVRGAIFCLATEGMVSRFLFRRLEEVVERADRYAEYIDGVQGTYQVIAWHQYRALAILGLAQDRESALGSIAPHRELLASLAQVAPENFEHRSLLLEAELARLDSNRGEALELYEQALASAHKYGFIQDEALANELAGRYLLDLGSISPARGYLLQAIFLYGCWGAAAKTTQMEEEFSELLAGFRHFMSARGGTTRTGTSTLSSASEVDLAAVIRASHSLSKQIVLSELVQSLVRLAMEVAGAQRGFLLLREGDSWNAVCQGEVGDGIELRTPQSYPDLPEKIIKYVRRTREDLILRHAFEEGLFRDDAYVHRRATRSVLCMPVQHQNELRAILYLENDLTGGAFTPHHLDLLRLLGAQAAISIDNAQLYDTLERRVEERTLKLRQEIKERTRVQEELRVLATTDSLTGAFNRRHFLELSEQEYQRVRRYPTPLAAVMLDADHFKVINDSYGHDVGDEVLKALARTVKAELRTSEIFGRLGGEEFAIALPATPAGGALVVAERLREAVGAIKIPREEGLEFTVSMGVAELQEGDDSFAALLSRADQALYQAKTRGRNQVVLAEAKVTT